MTREQMIDEAVRRTAGWCALNDSDKRGFISFVRLWSFNMRGERHAAVPLIRAEFRRIAGAA